MSTMKVYEALKSINVPDDKAAAAAEALMAAHHDRIEAIDTRLIKVESDVRLLTWMVGFNLLLSVGILSRLLFVGG